MYVKVQAAAVSRRPSRRPSSSRGAPSCSSLWRSPSVENAVGVEHTVTQKVDGVAAVTVACGYSAGLWPKERCRLDETTLRWPHPWQLTDLVLLTAST